MSPDRARKILNLKPTDGLEDARRAFRAKVKRLHPDRAGGRRRAAYEEVVAAWRALESESRPRAAMGDRLEPVQVIIAVSWLAVRMGETIEVEIPTRKIRVPLPTDIQSGDRLRVRGPGAEPDVVITVQISPQRTFAESLKRFVSDFAKPGEAA